MSIKKDIEDRLVIDPLVAQLFDVEDLYNEENERHLKVKTDKVKTDPAFDVDVCRVEIRTDMIPVLGIHVRAIRNAMRNMEGELIRKVCFLEYNEEEQEVIFSVINKLEKV